MRISGVKLVPTRQVCAIRVALGNTGIGLAIVCKEYGLKLKIVIPNTQSIEKKETLRNLGAELIEVDAVPYSDPNNYIKQSKKLAEDLNKHDSKGVYWANQFDNIINTEAHIKTTAEEIWSQTAGTINGFTCAVGTGGTLAGVSIGLKNTNTNIKIQCSRRGLVRRDLNTAWTSVRVCKKHQFALP